MKMEKAISNQDLKEMFPVERVYNIYKQANENGGFDEIWQISTAENRELIIKKLKAKIYV
jgi:hypothetical protein